jgi:prepilin-type processing-associated H-X9-DG protein
MITPAMGDYKSKESGPMDQTDESTQGQKPKIYKLAILSPLVVILGFWVGVIFAGWLKHISILSDLGLFVYYVSTIVGLVLGIIADRKIYKSKGMLKGRVFSIIGTGLAIILIVTELMPPPTRSADRVVCMINLHRLGESMKLYSEHYDQRYPTKDMWCDLLIEHADVNEITYVCRGASKSGDQGRCHYAINPNCDPNSPGDVVLLFETKGGWNQFGGPELLTTKHHKSKGCNILFNDSHVRFIETKQLSELKWDNKPKGESKQ